MYLCVTVAGLDFKQETREDRLARLVKNLTKLTNEATLDEQSALRTLVRLTTTCLRRALLHHISQITNIGNSTAAVPRTRSLT